MLEQPVTAAEAASALHVPAVDGALRSVVKGVVIDPHFAPATVLVNGRAARLASVLPDGARVTVTSGTDSVERRRRRDPGAGKKKADHGLWVGGAVGAAT